MTARFIIPPKSPAPAHRVYIKYDAAFLNPLMGQ